MVAQIDRGQQPQQSEDQDKIIEQKHPEHFPQNVFLKFGMDHFYRHGE